MTPIYVTKLGFVIWSTDIIAQKIINLNLEIYNIVIARFSLQDQLVRFQFFEKTLLLADISMEIVLAMSFLTLNQIGIDFLDPKLKWQTYTTSDILLTVHRVKFINKKEFTKTIWMEMSKNLWCKYQFWRLCKWLFISSEQLRLPCC